MQNTAWDAIRLLQQSFSSPVALANLNGQDLLRPSYISMFKTPRIASPNSRNHQTPRSRMRTSARLNHERSPTDTGVERAMNIENEFRTSPSQAAPDRRFYVDLSAQHEKVLLKEAKCHLKLNKQIQLELTNDVFQQFIHLLAVSWSALTQSSKSHGLGKRGERTITALCRCSRKNHSRIHASKHNKIV